MVPHRLPRIASRIKFLVSAVIQREIADPRLGLVTVLKVEPTQDLKEAKVYITIFGSPGVQSRTFHALEDARGFIQREVGKNLDTKNTPRLSFILDASQDKVSRIEALVEQAKEEREDAMAKKSGKKEDKANKALSPKPEKSASKSSKAAPAGEKGGPKSEEKENKLQKPGGPGRPGRPGRPKGYKIRDDDEGDGAAEKEFMGEERDEDDDKDFVDDADAEDEDDDDDDDDEEEEEEEEEEAGY